MTLRLQVDPKAPSGYRLTRANAPAARIDETDPVPELPPLPGQADPPTIKVGTMRGEMTDDGRANAYVWSGVSWELVASNQIVADELIDITIYQSDHNYDIGQIVLYKDTATSYQMWEAIIDHVLEGAAAPADPEWKLIGGSGGGGSAAGEVWIGPDDPIVANPGIELWYDSDAVASGQGLLPVGGAIGQVLGKKSATDYDTQWQNAGMRVFDTIAARDAAWPAATTPTGTVCTVAGRVMFIVLGGAWRVIGGVGAKVTQNVNTGNITEAGGMSAPFCVLSGVVALGVETIQLSWSCAYNGNPANFYIQRNGTTIYSQQIGGGSAAGNNPQINLQGSYFDLAPAGTHTYQIRAGGWWGSTVLVNDPAAFLVARVAF